MISRRTLLKSGALTLGGTALLPYLSSGEIPPVVPVESGRMQFSPFYGEYVPDTAWLNKPLRARLNSNENPYGPSPSALKAVQENASRGNLYGWSGIEELMKAIAEKEGVSPEQVLIGPGSTDFLEKSGMLFFQNGGELVSADPTFMTIIRTAQAVGATWKGIPLTNKWEHDLDRMTSAITNSTRMVYLCNPNNPTGTLTDTDQLIEFSRRASEKTVVFADEAYLEFLDPGTKSLTGLIKEGKNVLVARTFSKIHGLAGLRIGYLLGQPETLKAISNCSFTGMGISNTSVAAALASINDQDFVDSCRVKNAEARMFTFDGLKKLGFDPVRSHTSFMIFPIRMNGPEFSKGMYNQGIGIRTLRINNKDWCRVSMGTTDSMKIFLDGLQNI